MGKRHNASRLAYSDTDELALLIRLLPEWVNPYASYHIRQWRYDNRLRLFWLELRLPLRLRLWRCPGLCRCRLLFFPTSLEFQFKILATKKGVTDAACRLHNRGLNDLSSDQIKAELHSPDAAQSQAADMPAPDLIPGQCLQIEQLASEAISSTDIFLNTPTIFTNTAI